MWSVLPDELWRRIIEIGIETQSLDYKGICCLSTTCRRLRRLADDDSVWSLLLLLSDFLYVGNDLNLSDINCNSSSTANAKFKSLYKFRYEKERELGERVREFRERYLQRHLQFTQEVERMHERLAEVRNAAMAGD